MGYVRTRSTKLRHRDLTRISSPQGYLSLAHSSPNFKGLFGHLFNKSESFLLLSTFKTTNALTPYWLTLSLNKRERISLPIAFGEKQKQRIEEAFKGDWSFTAVEMIKCDREWYAHFVLIKIVELPDEPETVIAIDRGERNLAVAVAISKRNPEKPMKGNGAARRSSVSEAYTDTSEGSSRRSTGSERLRLSTGRGVR